MNQFGLAWSKQKENFIKNLDDDNVIFQGAHYICVGNICSDSSGKRVSAILEGEHKDLLRQKHSYFYRSQEGDLYLMVGNKIFTKKQSVDEKDFSPYFTSPFSIHKNTLIKGDNLPALKLLSEQFDEEVDVIIIDPPYNTGNEDMKYNDSFPVLENGDKHSSWLSFMYERLIVSKDLMKEDALIFINIDEYEYPYLRLLCDQVFGVENLVESFVWEKNSTKNNSKTTSTNHESILCYSKNKKTIEGKGFFRVPKAGTKELYGIRDSILSDNSIPLHLKRKAVESAIQAFLKENKELKGIKQYRRVDDEFNIYRISDVSAPGGNGAHYNIIHPVTGKVCKNPQGGYRYSESKLQELIDNNRLHFGKDERTVPQYKRFLHEVEDEVAKSVIRNTDEGKKELEAIFGVSPFNNPKPTSLIKHLISMIPKEKMVCLDFFAGSGSTGHAVLDYNKEHKTQHTFILVTNNENNIHDGVTKPRITFIRDNEEVCFTEVVFRKTF